LNFVKLIIKSKCVRHFTEKRVQETKAPNLSIFWGEDPPENQLKENA